MNDTKTSLGRALMREWFLRPSMSLDVIRRRHDAIECCLRPDNLATMETMHGHLKGTKNIPRVLAALRTGKGKVCDWQALVKVRSTLLRIWLLTNNYLSTSLLSMLYCSGMRC